MLPRWSVRVNGPPISALPEASSVVFGSFNALLRSQTLSEVAATATSTIINRRGRKEVIYGWLFQYNTLIFNNINVVALTGKVKRNTLFISIWPLECKGR